MLCYALIHGSKYLNNRPFLYEQAIIQSKRDYCKLASAPTNQGKYRSSRLCARESDYAKRCWAIDTEKIPPKRPPSVKSDTPQITPDYLRVVISITAPLATRDSKLMAVAEKRLSKSLTLIMVRQSWQMSRIAHQSSFTCGIV